MSEILKNIETCRGEDVLAEVSALSQDPHFGSLVNEALDPLKQQAAAQEGWDGYSEVIAQHKPYIFVSAIIQMRSNLLLLLRALWQFPFGSGTLRSLSDMWQHYITRLSGNETYGIPSRLSSLTDLPSAPLLVSDRKISGADVPDGMSVAHLIGETTTAATVEELSDTNYGWTLNGTFSKFFNVFPNLKRAYLNCQKIIYATDTNGIFDGHSLLDWSLDELEYIQNTNGGYNNVCFKAMGKETLSVPKLKEYRSSSYGKFLVSDDVVKHVDCHSLEMIAIYHSATWFADCPELLDVDFSALQDFTSNGNTTFASNCPKLWWVKIGKTTGHLAHSLSNTQNINFTNCDKLIRLEFTDGLDVSTNISTWSPDLSDSDVLTLFLQNFRTYIALRLADNGSGLTLTLSQAVYDAIKDESHLFVFDEGTMTIYAFLTNIKHWTVTK